MKLSPNATIEKLFPSPAGRRAGDAAIDSLDAREPMTVFLDAWEAAYCAKAGTSPFRPRSA